jgi:hypothetical protein
MSEEEVAKSTMGITKKRLRELSGLFNLYSAGGDRCKFAAQQKSKNDYGSVTREERLAWASEIIHRPLPSFFDLSEGEAAQLIATLRSALGKKS